MRGSCVPIVVAVQMWASLWCLVWFAQAPATLPQVQQMWHARLLGCRHGVEVWQRILAVRARGSMHCTHTYTHARARACARTHARLHMLQVRALVEPLSASRMDISALLKFSSLCIKSNRSQTHWSMRTIGLHVKTMPPGPWRQCLWDARVALLCDLIEMSDWGTQ